MLPLLIDTRSVAVPDRRDFWANASSEIYHPLHIGLDPGVEFDGHMWGAWLTSIGLFRVAASANTMTRRWEDIALGDPECMHVSIILSGRLWGEQAGRASVAGPGDLTAYDTSVPAVFHAPEPFDMLVLKLPKAALGRRAGQIARSTALRIAGASGLPRVATQFFCGVASAVADGSIAPDDADVAERVVDLASRLFSDLDASRSTTPRTRAELRERAHAFMDEHLGDPDLRPEHVARGCFISTRYLHRLFAEDGLSVARLIRNERLARCRRDLLDPALAGDSITAIGTRWGFASLSHFSRVFRDTYGASPREYRRRARAETPRASLLDE